MNLLRKTLIILLILLFSVILYQIWKDKKEAFSNFSFKEGLSTSDKQYGAIISEIQKIAIDTDQLPPGYLSLDKSLRNLELKHFCIKSSFNSAFTGKSYISDEMVKYVLSRGCRLLDFEVFFSGNDPYIGYSGKSGENKPSNDIQNTNNITLTRMMIDTLANAFVSQKGDKYYCTNIEDPLFIYLRLKTGKTNNITYYQYIKESLDKVKSYSGGVYSRYFYKGNVTKNTRIGNICEKVVFIFNNDGIDPAAMGDYCNMIVGVKGNMTNDFEKYFYEDLDNKDIKMPSPISVNTNKVNVDQLTMVTIRDDEYNTKNVDNKYQIYPTIRDYGSNFSLFKYYETDWKLLNCEKLFKHYNYGIIPMTYALSYIDIYPSSDQMVLQIGIQ